MSDIAANLAEIRQRISHSCLRVGRELSTVELIAVSKTFPADAVREAAGAGQLHFGESKLQEAEPKIELLPGALHWHFIGRVQRNKVRRILPLFEVIHAIDSLRLASYTNDVAAELGLFPKVFLQVNIGGEESKGGFEPEILREEIEALLSLRRMEILGLMCIPPAAPDAESARPWFAALRELRDDLVTDFRHSSAISEHGDERGFRGGHRGRRDSRPRRVLDFRKTRLSGGRRAWLSTDSAMPLILENAALIGDELALSFADGFEAYLPLPMLRRACPCAVCQGEPDALGRVVRPKVEHGPKCVRTVQIRTGRRIRDPAFLGGRAFLRHLCLRLSAETRRTAASVIV